MSDSRQQRRRIQQEQSQNFIDERFGAQSRRERRKVARLLAKQEARRSHELLKARAFSPEIYNRQPENLIRVPTAEEIRKVVSHAPTKNLQRAQR